MQTRSSDEWVRMHRVHCRDLLVVGGAEEGHSEGETLRAMGRMNSRIGSGYRTFSSFPSLPFSSLNISLGFPVQPIVLYALFMPYLKLEKDHGVSYRDVWRRLELFGMTETPTLAERDARQGASCFHSLSPL